jgi:glutamate-1-semialdehyde 2,1-aminomutase
MEHSVTRHPVNSKWKTSAAMLQRAQQSLTGGVSSPFRAKTHVPLYFKDGLGARLLDVDDNWYIDYTLGWGPNILGYKHPELIEAVRWAAEGVHDYGAQHEMEYLVSEKIQAMVPCAERVGYTCSGSEALQIVMRLARAATGRNLILKFEGHYHGWMDSALLSYHPSADEAGPLESPNVVPGSKGQVPNAKDNVVVVRWNSVDAVEEALQRYPIAAVLMEPVLCNSGCIPPQPGYLERVRELCTAKGTLLIFDEVITGFRIGLGGAQGFFKVTPDLATFGKALAGGVALSAFAGRKDIMELTMHGGVSFGGTFNGNPIAMAAALATLNVLGRGALWDASKVGAQLMKGIKNIASRQQVPMLLTGFPTAFAVHFTKRRELREYRDLFEDDADRLRRFVAAMIEQGVNVLPDGRIYVSAVHTEDDVQETLSAVEKALF